MAAVGRRALTVADSPEAQHKAVASEYSLAKTWPNLAKASIVEWPDVSIIHRVPRPFLGRLLDHFLHHEALDLV
jgi:hypothetical protein